MQENFYSATTISYKKPIAQVIITFLLSLVIGGIYSYDLIIFGAALLGSAVVVFGVAKPKYMLYFILFSSSVLSFYPLALYTTFFEGTSFQINLQGLRNVLIIVVTIPLIMFHFKEVVKAKFFFPIMLYILVFTMTTIINFSSDDIRLFTNIVSPFLFYFLMLIFIKDESDKKAVLTAIILSSFIPIIVAFLQYFHVMRLYEKYSYNISGRRIHSTFDLANTFGVYMVMFSFISILNFLKAKKLFSKIWSGIYLIGAHIALLMTLSRNAIFSLLLASVMVANAKWGILRSALVGLMLVVVLFSIPGFNERLLSPSQKIDVSVFDVFSRFDFETLNFYSMGRLNIWRDWWYMILESTPKEYILGHGFDANLIKGRYFHNEFLRTFWVSGIVGLVFYIYVIAYMLYTIYSWMRRSLKKGKLNIYYLSAFSYMFAMTFMLNFDNIKEKHQIWVYYFALLALAEITKEKETT